MISFKNISKSFGKLQVLNQVNLDLVSGKSYALIGPNGSGKTTLSRLFRALETRTVPASALVTISINGKDVGGDGFAYATLPIRVFNRDFVMESTFPVGGGDMPPIVVVGKESVENRILPRLTQP